MQKSCARQPARPTWHRPLQDGGGINRRKPPSSFHRCAVTGGGRCAQRGTPAPARRPDVLLSVPFLQVGSFKTGSLVVLPEPFDGGDECGGGMRARGGTATPCSVRCKRQYGSREAKHTACACEQPMWRQDGASARRCLLFEARAVRGSAQNMRYVCL